jgi:hypothetical protein
MTDAPTPRRSYLRLPNYGYRSTQEQLRKYNKLNLTTEEYEEQCSTDHKRTTLDTESKKTVAYSSRTIITTEEYDIKMPCGIRNLNHSIGEREELKRTMKAKAGLEKMARDRKKMADKRSLNINQRNRKQKQSTKDVLERRDNNPYLAACKIRIWEEMSGTPIAPRGANKRNREFTGAISRILQRAGDTLAMDNQRDITQHSDSKRRYLYSRLSLKE